MNIDFSNYSYIKGDVFKVSGCDALVVPGQRKTNWNPLEGRGIEAKVYKSMEGTELWGDRQHFCANLNMTECWTYSKKPIPICDYEKLIFVSPPINATDPKSEVWLYMSYYNVFREALNRGVKKLVVPLLGSGRNGFPEELSRFIAEEAYINFITGPEEEAERYEGAEDLCVMVVCYDGQKEDPTGIKHGIGQNRYFDDLRKEGAPDIVYKPDRIYWEDLLKNRKMFLKKQYGKKVSEKNFGEGLVAKNTYDTHMGKHEVERLPQRGTIIDLAEGEMLSVDQVNAMLRSRDKKQTENQKVVYELSAEESRRFERTKLAKTMKDLAEEKSRKEDPER